MSDSIAARMDSTLVEVWHFTNELHHAHDTRRGEL